MARPTKEEAERWTAWVEDTRRERRQPHAAELGALRDFLDRVHATLEHRRTQERRARRRNTALARSECPLCGAGLRKGQVCTCPK